MNETARRWPAFVAAAAPLVAVPAAIAAEMPAGDENLEEIVVTGSRIRQPLENAPVPVFIVDRDAIERTSQDAIGKVLQQLPMNTGFASNTNVNAGNGLVGDGTTRINLRGLGAERTLVLVDGRRFVYGGNGGDTAVDVNMIPMSVLDRVEVVGVGSSTTYGSDAIGGVVNLITRTDFTGAEINGSYATNDHDDGHVYDLQFVAGQSGDRGHLIFGAELVDQQEVFQAARDYSAHTEYVRNDGSIGYSGSLGTPQGVYRVPPGNALGLPGGVDVLYTRVDGSGSPPTGADFREYDSSRDFYDFAPVNYLQTPNKRQYLWMLGGYDLNDHLSIFLDALWHHRDSEQLLAPTPFYSGDPAAGSPILADGQPGIPADNYYNPFGVDLEWPWAVARRFTESVGRRFTEDARTQWYVAGLRGQVGESSWNWEFSADYGRNDTQVTTEGEFRTDRLRLALNHSGLDAAGNVVCSRDPVIGVVPTQSIIPGCVPMDLFGGQGPDGKGTISRAMLDYATGTLTDDGYNEQQVYELIFRGDWGSIQDRAIKWAAGALRRAETSAAELDPAKLAGTVGGQQTNLNGGGDFTANEAYAEAVVPVLEGVAAAEMLNLTAGLRYSDFSSFGSVTTYQGGMVYRPIAGVTLRGGYGTVFRAPPIVALYSSNLVTVDGFADPCGNEPTASQAANCAAAGVPGGSYEQPQDDAFLVRIGGNSDLQPETGDSTSAGLTLAPPSVPGLEISADYWRTALDDVITIDPMVQLYVTACANSGAPDACGRVQRRPDGSIAMIDGRHANGASLTAAGYDFDVGYTKPLAGGDLSARVTATYLSEYDYVPVTGAGTIHAAGKGQYFGGLPRWRGLGYLEYAHGPWSASYQAQYIGAMTEYLVAGVNVPEDGMTGLRRIDDRWYQDLRFAYTFERGPIVTLAINNLSGSEPPRVIGPAGANTYPWAYPLLGRTYIVQLGYRVK